MIYDTGIKPFNYKRKVLPIKPKPVLDFHLVCQLKENKVIVHLSGIRTRNIEV